MLSVTKIDLYPENGSLGLEFKIVQDGRNEFLAVKRFTRDRKFNPVYALRKPGPAEASGKIRPGDFLLQINDVSVTEKPVRDVFKMIELTCNQQLPVRFTFGTRKQARSMASVIQGPTGLQKQISSSTIRAMQKSGASPRDIENFVQSTLKGTPVNGIVASTSSEDEFNVTLDLTQGNELGIDLARGKKNRYVVIRAFFRRNGGARFLVEASGAIFVNDRIKAVNGFKVKNYNDCQVKLAKACLDGNRQLILLIKRAPENMNRIIEEPNYQLLKRESQRSLLRKGPNVRERIRSKAMQPLKPTVKSKDEYVVGDIVYHAVTKLRGTIQKVYKDGCYVLWERALEESFHKWNQIQQNSKRQSLPQKKEKGIAIRRAASAQDAETNSRDRMIKSFASEPDRLTLRRSEDLGSPVQMRGMRKKGGKRPKNADAVRTKDGFISRAATAIDDSSGSDYTVNEDYTSEEEEEEEEEEDDDDYRASATFSRKASGSKPAPRKAESYGRKRKPLPPTPPVRDKPPTPKKKPPTPKKKPPKPKKKPPKPKNNKSSSTTDNVESIESQLEQLKLKMLDAMDSEDNQALEKITKMNSKLKKQLRAIRKAEKDRAEEAARQLEQSVRDLEAEAKMIAEMKTDMVKAGSNEDFLEAQRLKEELERRVKKMLKRAKETRKNASRAENFLLVERIKKVEKFLKPRK